MTEIFTRTDGDKREPVEDAYRDDEHITKWLISEMDYKRLMGKEVNDMASAENGNNSRAEMVADYRASRIRGLGMDADDPRCIAAVDARVLRFQETLAHMDRPLPREIGMQAGQEYSSLEQ